MVYRILFEASTRPAYVRLLLTQNLDNNTIRER